MDTPSTQVYKLIGYFQVELNAFSEDDAKEALREFLLGIESLGGILKDGAVAIVENA